MRPRPATQTRRQLFDWAAWKSLPYTLFTLSVFLGYVGWAAGNFANGYVLSETPTQAGAAWTDTALVTLCLAPKTQKLPASVSA